MRLGRSFAGCKIAPIRTEMTNSGPAWLAATQGALETRPRRLEVGIALHRGPIVFQGLRAFSQVQQSVAQVVMRRCVLRIDLERPAIARDSFLETLDATQRVPQVVLRLRELGFELERVFVERNGLRGA